MTALLIPTVDPGAAGLVHAWSPRHQERPSDAVATVPAAVAALRSGQMIILVDAQDREDEGDLVMPAQLVTPDAVNFMATHGRGLVCVATTRETLDRLAIPPMTATPSDPLGTAFHVGVDHRTLCTTGISASDRAATIRALASAESVPSDFTQPGHVFPLAAREGGVLERPGHTEASVDLVRMAALAPAAVICEIANAAGEMARRPALRELARQHELPMLTIDDLLAYRLAHQPLVQRTATARLPLAHGEFTAIGYRGLTDGREHLALVRRAPTTKGALVYVHPECPIGDVFDSQRCKCAMRLDGALREIADSGSGAVVYLRTADGSRNTHHRSETTVDDYWVATQIVTDLGIASPRLLTDSAAEASALRASGQRWARC